MERKRVIIVGGGYAGVQALKILAPSGECDIVLIDQHPYHYLQTEAYELIANECSMTRVMVDLLTNQEIKQRMQTRLQRLKLSLSAQQADCTISTLIENEM